MRRILTLALLLWLPAVAHAKVLYSPVLSTVNGADSFHCTFLNTHTSREAIVSLVIFDYETGTTALEEVLTVEPGAAAGWSVAGPGTFICVFEAKGGKVQAQVSFESDGRFTEIQTVK